MTIETDTGSCELTEQEGHYEISHHTGGLESMSKAIRACTKDKPIYFTVDFDNEDAFKFYRRLTEMGKIQISHIVCKVIR